jgi:SEC-C motif domain protein
MTTEPSPPEETQEEERIPRIREISLCPCKSKKSYADCCLPFHYGRAQPETAEQLMRARYAAFFFRRVDYLVSSTHPRTREWNLKQQLDASIHDYQWSFLEILQTSKGGKDDKTGKVEFIAHFFHHGQPGELHEHSRFTRSKGIWKYLDGKG